LVWSILICLLVGSASEVLQIFTGRDPRIADVILNLASGTLGAAIQVCGRSTSKLYRGEQSPPESELSDS